MIVKIVGRWERSSLASFDSSGHPPVTEQQTIRIETEDVSTTEFSFEHMKDYRDFMKSRLSGCRIIINNDYEKRCKDGLIRTFMINVKDKAGDTQQLLYAVGVGIYLVNDQGDTIEVIAR